MSTITLARALIALTLCLSAGALPAQEAAAANHHAMAERATVVKTNEAVVLASDRVPASEKAPNPVKIEIIAVDKTQKIADQPEGSVPVAPKSDMPTFATELSKARELIRTGHVAEATSTLERARDQAERRGDRAEQANALFYLGTAAQSRLQTQVLSDNEKKVARQTAITAYRDALVVNPSSGPALNNLAQLYRADPSKAAQADAMLMQAIELNDARKPVYLLNRAMLKRDAGDLPSAYAIARQAAAADRANPDAHRLVTDVALASDNAVPALGYAAELNENGLVMRSLQLAAAALQRFPEQRAEILVSIAASLASDAYTDLPQRFAGSDIGKAVFEFRNDEVIGEGVRELFDVLKGPVSPIAIKWWMQGFQRHERAQSDLRSATMQRLIRHCAEIHRRFGKADDIGLAEGYYRNEIEIFGPSANPATFIALGEILFDSERIDELESILEHSEVILLQQKGMALERADHRRVFELRLALGMMYAYTGRWNNPKVFYASAVWMLEHAEQSASEHNVDRPPAEQIWLPPDAVKLLSSHFSARGELLNSVDVRLRAAQQYVAGMQTERVAEVLDNAWRASLPVDLERARVARIAELIEDQDL